MCYLSEGYSIYFWHSLFQIQPQKPQSMLRSETEVGKRERDTVSGAMALENWEWWYITAAAGEEPPKCRSNLGTVKNGWVKVVLELTSSTAKLEK